MKKYASRIYLCIVFGILYIPILTLILFSFNASESTANFNKIFAGQIDPDLEENGRLYR